MYMHMYIWGRCFCQQLLCHVYYRFYVCFGGLPAATLFIGKLQVGVQGPPNKYCKQITVYWHLVAEINRWTGSNSLLRRWPCEFELGSGFRV